MISVITMISPITLAELGESERAYLDAEIRTALAGVPALKCKPEDIHISYPTGQLPEMLASTEVPAFLTKDAFFKVGVYPGRNRNRILGVCAIRRIRTVEDLYFYTFYCFVNTKDIGPTAANAVRKIFALHGIVW